MQIEVLQEVPGRFRKGERVAVHPSLAGYLFERGWAVEVPTSPPGSASKAKRKSSKRKRATAKG